MFKLLVSYFVFALGIGAALHADMSGRYDSQVNCQYIGADFLVEDPPGSGNFVQFGGKFPDVLPTDLWFIHQDGDRLRMVEFFPDTDDFVIHYEGVIFDDVRNPGLKRVGFGSCGVSRELDQDGNQYIHTGVWDVRTKSGTPTVSGRELLYGYFFGQQYTSPCIASMRRSSEEIPAAIKSLLQQPCESATGQERYCDYFGGDAEFCPAGN